MRGIDAALLSEYTYSDNGQLLTQSFMDHLLASAMEVPHFTMDDICTPAPAHPLGVKGAGEGGYMTGPAAIISAIEDAISDYDIHLSSIPMTPTKLFELLSMSTKGA